MKYDIYILFRLGVNYLIVNAIITHIVSYIDLKTTALVELIEVSRPISLLHCIPVYSNNNYSFFAVKITI